MKKFFVTALLVWAMILSTAFAANYDDIDWDEVPEINNKLEFHDYIVECEEDLQTVIPVILTDGFRFDWNNKWMMAPVQWKNYTVVQDDGETCYLVLEIENYPGTRISEAYLRDDTSFLTADELKVYYAVTEALMEFSDENTDDEYEEELLLCKFLDNWVSYKTADYSIVNGEKMPRFVTAIGAFLDNKANCQGYSDAFYMLGNMYGFEVGRVVGTTSGGGLHMWNTIIFDDGRTYMVDVTWEDADIEFTKAGNVGDNVYFNAPLEIMTATHSWDTELTPKVVRKIDDRYYYARTGNKFKTADEALHGIAREMVNGSTLIYAMAPYDANYANQKADIDYLYDNILVAKYNWNGNFQMLVKQVGNYLFFIADCSSNYQKSA